MHVEMNPSCHSMQDKLTDNSYGVMLTLLLVLCCNLIGRPPPVTSLRISRTPALTFGDLVGLPPVGDVLDKHEQVRDLAQAESLLGPLWMGPDLLGNVSSAASRTTPTPTSKSYRPISCEPDWKESSCGLFTSSTRSRPDARGSRSPNTKVGTNRIFNGTSVIKGQFPWVVRLKYPLPKGSELCSGTVVTDRLILTAANCLSECFNGQVFEVKPKFIKLKLPFNSEKDIKIWRIVYSERYDRCKPDPGFDWAWLVTDRPIKLRSPRNPTSRTSRVCLHERNSTVASPTFWVAGWGSTSADKPSNRDMFAGLLSHDKECRSLDRAGFSYDKSNIICGLDTYRAACHGDAGGPVMVFMGSEWHQIAIISSSDSKKFSCSGGSPIFSAKIRDDWRVAIESTRLSTLIERGTLARG